MKSQMMTTRNGYYDLAFVFIVAESDLLILNKGYGLWSGILLT
ncbi:MAG: hypothetical protein ABIN24_02415 [Dyadobacter sp.]